MRRRQLLTMLGGAAAAPAFRARAAVAQPVRIGVLADMAGPLSNISGPAAVWVAQIAAQDFGNQVLGRPIEIVSGDMGNRVDIGAGLARQWFDEDGVEMICDMPNSAVALAVQSLANQRRKIALQTGAGTTELTEAQCSFFGVHWVFDTYTQAASTVGAAMERGGDTWFLIVTDYAFGISLESSARALIEKNGGKVVGSIRYPTDTTDFSSYLVQAQASGAKVIGFATNTAGTENLIKQAHEFGISRSKQIMAPMIIYLPDVHALGLETVQGTLAVEAYYWDLDDPMRAFGKRFMAKNGAMPNQTQAAIYGAVQHYLKCVAAAGTTDGETVMKAIRGTPVDDFMTHDARIRIDGRLVRDTYLFEVKKPSESRGEWDCYKLVHRIPGEQTVIPEADSKCPLFHS